MSIVVHFSLRPVIRPCDASLPFDRPPSRFPSSYLLIQSILPFLQNQSFVRMTERGHGFSREVDGGDENQIQNQNEAKRGEGGGKRIPKGKSCKGYMYYSSTLKSKGSNPRCVGIPRTLYQPPNVVGEAEMKASKEGKAFKDFYYGCAGYSVFINGRSSSDKQGSSGEGLPACIGLEGKPSTADSTSAPAHVHRKEDGRELPQPRTQKPAHSSGEDFLGRYTRNANLVASGVARNVRRVGNYVKESLDDALYTYRRRPK